MRLFAQDVGVDKTRCEIIEGTALLRGRSKVGELETGLGKCADLGSAMVSWKAGGHVGYRFGDFRSSSVSTAARWVSERP